MRKGVFGVFGEVDVVGKDSCKIVFCVIKYVV